MFFANAFLLALWWHSLWAAAVVGLVLLVRTLIFRGSLARWRSLLWVIVLMRLVLPALPSSQISISNIKSWLDRPRSPITNAFESPRPLQHASGRTVITSGYLPPFEENKPAVMTAPALRDDSHRSFNLIWIWIVGVVAVVASRLIGHGLFLRRLARQSADPSVELLAMLTEACQRMRVRVPPRLLMTDAVPAPALAGLFRPRLLLPPSVAESLAPSQLRLVMLHELAHLRRKDLWIDSACTLVIAMHWFNPAVWLAAAMYRSDRELARDAMVIHAAGEEQANDYGRAMVALLEGVVFSRRTPMTVVGMLERWGGLQLRVRNIARYRRAGVASALTASVMLVVIGCASLTGPTEDKARAAKPAIDLSTDSPSKKISTESHFPYSGELGYTESHLDKNLSKVDLDGVTAAEALDRLRDAGPTNIFVNWRVLQRSGITKNTKVGVKLQNVTFARALEALLGNLGGDRVKLGYEVDAGIITVSTQDELAIKTVTRTYDVRDMLVDIPDFTDAPTLGIVPANQPVKPAHPSTRPAQEKLDAIVSLIKETIDPSSWDGEARIKENAGKLVVTQTEANQQAISSLLEGLHRARGLQITVESRFITVDDAEIKRNPALKPLARIAAEAAIGLPSPSLYLEKNEVDKLLRAANEPANSSLITTQTSPRLTLFNGQRAYVMVAQVQAYVSDVQIVRDSKDVVGFQPSVGQVSSGILFDVQAMASADRKYVTMTVRPQLSRLAGFDTAPLPAVRKDSKEVSVQIPVLTNEELPMTVSVPDGGTLVATGFKEHSPTGHPFPDDHKRIYMLVRPTIVDQYKRAD